MDLYHRAVWSDLKRATEEHLALLANSPDESRIRAIQLKIQDLCGQLDALERIEKKGTLHDHPAQEIVGRFRAH